MEKLFSKADFHKHLRELWEKRGFPVPENDQVGLPIEQLIKHSLRKNKSKKSPHIDLWVAILDEYISWFISLSSVAWDKPSEGEKATNFEASLFLIIGKIIADMIALRHLVLIGFDTSARTILRSLAEYLEVLVALIHQPAFADDFVQTDTPEHAQKFWENHLRGGGIRKRVTAAWNEFFGSKKRNGTAEWFANWGRNAVPMLSGLAHPSLAGGLFTAIPLKSQYKADSWPGFFGDKAESSVDTIFILLQFVFPVLLLTRTFPFGMAMPQFRSPRTYNENDELHRHVHIGRDVLASVILSLSKESNAQHVFPEIDMSIWPE